MKFTLLAGFAAGISAAVLPEAADISNIKARASCNATTPPPPSQDPWYSPPANYESTAPGTVLKVRNACGVKVTNASAVYNILYRTTDSRYLPTWAVTTLILPFQNISSCDKLLSYQIPYDSADLDASPSYSLYTGGGLFGTGDITTALGNGWIVNTPDYEGPKASFVAGVQSGHATLDAVRAVRNANLGFDKNGKIALWGYSGGALASEWALELQVQYAPRLTIAGAALGGLTPNVTSVLFTINGTVYAGLAPAGIIGITSQFPDAAAFVQSQLHQTGEFNATRFNATKNYTLIESIGAFAGQDIGKYFINGLDTLNAPLAKRVQQSDGLMGYHGIPASPIFAYKAIGDDISVIADTDKLVDRYCEVGATIRYDRNTVGNHASETYNGAPRALAFLKTIFDGTYSATGCQIQNVTVSA